jgi:hypothetical protein
VNGPLNTLSFPVEGAARATGPTLAPLLSGNAGLLRVTGCPLPDLLERALGCFGEVLEALMASAGYTVAVAVSTHAHY